MTRRLRLESVGVFVIANVKIDTAFPMALSQWKC
jgi:hypothetical protein